MIIVVWLLFNETITPSDSTSEILLFIEIKLPPALKSSGDLALNIILHDR